jgi:hypothetical protein
MRPFATILLALTAACARATDTTPSLTTTHDSAGITIVENDFARATASCSVDSTPVFSIGVDEGEPDYELYRVFGATRLSDGRIAVANQGTNEVRFYDAAGRFTGRSGREGQGPGEYSNIFYLWALPGDTLYVGDYDPWHYEVLDGQGTFIRSVRPEPVYPNSPSTLVLLDDGSSVLGDEDMGRPGPEYVVRMQTVLRHDRDGRLRDTVGVFPNGRWGRDPKGRNNFYMYPLFESFTRISGAGMRVVIGHSSRPELRVLRAGDSLALERLVRWTATGTAVTQADIDAERERLRAMYKDVPPAMVADYVDPLINERRPIAESMPVFAGVLVGRDERIWLREYRRPTQTPEQNWIVLERDGAFFCRLQMPKDAGSILEAGADYVLTHATSADDVEMVRQYRVREAQ